MSQNSPKSSFLPSSWAAEFNSLLTEGAGSPAPFQGVDESDPAYIPLFTLIFHDVPFDRLCWLALPSSEDILTTAWGNASPATALTLSLTKLPTIGQRHGKPEGRALSWATFDSHLSLVLLYDDLGDG